MVSERGAGPLVLRAGGGVLVEGALILSTAVLAKPPVLLVIRLQRFLQR